MQQQAVNHIGYVGLSCAWEFPYLCVSFLHRFAEHRHGPCEGLNPKKFKLQEWKSCEGEKEKVREIRLPRLWHLLCMYDMYVGT